MTWQSPRPKMLSKFNAQLLILTKWLKCAIITSSQPKARRQNVRIRFDFPNAGKSWEEEYLILPEVGDLIDPPTGIFHASAKVFQRRILSKKESERQGVVAIIHVSKH